MCEGYSLRWFDSLIAVSLDPGKTDLDEILPEQVDYLQSISAVFKAIVPHLSTPFKVDLSYDAVRSKSYAAEERDKKIVIEILQDVIAKIKRY